MFVLFFVIFCLIALIVYYAAVLHVFKGIWNCAAYIVPAFVMFLWGPNFVFQIIHNYIVDGIIWVIITLLIMRFIYSFEQLTVPVLILIYTAIYYAVASIFITNTIVFVIVSLFVLLIGFGAGMEFIENMGTCKKYAKNIIVMLLFRIFTVPIYWYTSILLESCFMHTRQLGKSGAWLEFYKEPFAFNELNINTPYIWVSFLITGIIFILGIIFDIRDYKEEKTNKVIANM